MAGSEEKPVDKAKGAEKVEEKKESPKGKGEDLHQEANSGKADLVKKQKENTDRLKAGGKSGISSHFGSASEIFGADAKAMKAAVKEPPKAEAKDAPKDARAGEVTVTATAVKAAPEKQVSDAAVTKAAADLFAYTVGYKDADSVLKVLQKSSEAELKVIKEKYKAMTGTPLDEMLAKFYDGIELKKMQQFLNKKDAEVVQVPKGVDRDSMVKAAIDIQAAANRMNGMNDIDTVNKVLLGKKPDELQTLDALYKERYGLSLNDQMQHLMPPMTLKERLEWAKKRDHEQQEAKVDKEARSIDLAASWVGDADEVVKALRGKTEAQIKKLDESFKKQNGESLEAFFKKELEEPERSKAIELLHHKDEQLAKVPETVDRAKLQEANEEIYNAQKWKMPYSDQQIGDSAVYNKVLGGKKPDEIKAMSVLFKEKYGETLEEHLQRYTGPGLPADFAIKYAQDVHERKENFKVDADKVDKDQMEKLLDRIDAAIDEKPPVAVVKGEAVIGFPPGEHPVEKLLENRSAAELKALQDLYRERHGYELGAKLSQIEYGAGDRLRRLMDRDYKGALDKLSLPERADAHARAETIYRAMIPKTEPGGTTPRDAIFNALEKQSPEKRQAIEEAFKEISGGTMTDWIKEKYDGDDQEKALNYLKYGSRDESANLHLALTKKSDSDVRSMIFTRNSKEIAELDQAYKERYGQSLSEAILKNDGLDKDTRAALEIALKGTDYLKTHPGEWDKLISISLGDYNSMVARATHKNVGNLQMFKELMAAAPADARTRFLMIGGLDIIDKAFNDDKKDARDYALQGGLSLERQFKKQIGFWSDDHDAITKAADENHDDQDHKDYLAGARVFQKYYYKMSDEQRYAYDTAAQMNNDKVPAVLNIGEMNEEELRLYVKFQDINNALDRGLYNKNGMKFRDHIIYSGGKEQAINDLDKLSLDELKKLQNPIELSKYLHDHNIDLMSNPAKEDIIEAIGKRWRADKAEDLKYVDGDSMAKAIKIIPQTGHPDSMKLVDTIKQMTLEDQKKYRNDPEFRKEVDAAVYLMTNADYQTAAKHMLENVAKGGIPDGDWIDKINMEAGDKETDEPQVIRYVEQEFQKNPGLFERISNPKTDEDRALKTRLEAALHRALEEDEFNTWGKQVLANGRLTIEEKMDIADKKGNKKSPFIDIQNLAGAEDAVSVAERHKLVTDEAYRESVLKVLPEKHRELATNMLMRGEERHRLLTDVAYQNQVLDHLPKDKLDIAYKLLDMAKKDPEIISNARHRDAVLSTLKVAERDVAQIVLKWGSISSEDSLKSYELGVGVSKQQLMQTLRELTPDQNINFHEAYAAKYQNDVVTVLTDELKGSDEKKMLQEVRLDAVTAREALRDAKEIVDKSNSGFGAKFTHWWGSGAGDLGAARILELQAKIEAASADGKEMSVEDARKLAKDATEYAQLFDEAKNKAANEFANLVITAASFVVPGGFSLRLLAIATGGGLVKVGIKEAIAGNADMTDFASGFVQTGLSALGPKEIAGALGLGEKVALQAGERVVAQGGKLMVQGAEKALAKELRGAAAGAMAHGGGVIENKAIDQIVTKFAKAGATDLEKQALRQMIVQEFETAVKDQVRKGIVGAVTREGLSVAGGSVGGFAGGITEATLNYDTDLSFSANMSNILEAGLMGSVEGAKGALIWGAAFKVAGGGYRLLKHAAAGEPVVAASHFNVVAKEGEYAIVRPENAPVIGAGEGPGAPRVIEVPANKLTPVGGHDYYIGAEGKIYKKVGEGADGKLQVVHDPHAQFAVGESAVARIESQSRTMQEPLPKRGEDGAPAEAKPESSVAYEPLSGASGAFRVEDLNPSPGSRGAHGESAHSELTTAPREYLTLEGQRLTPNREIVIGRAGEIQVADGHVSGRHASVRVDEHGNTYIKDLGSSNGTFVNGQRLMPEHGEYMLRPGDIVNLGSTHQVSWARGYEARYQLSMGSHNVAMRAGHEVPISSGVFGTHSETVTASNARVGMDERGMYVIEDAANPSIHGTFVNGQRLAAGEKLYLQPTDNVYIGHPHSRQGEWLHVMPREVSRVPDNFQPANAQEFEQAVRQSNEYAQHHQTSERLQDGWQNAGGGQHFDSRGDFSGKYRNAVVVDRVHDPVLRQVIHDAKERFGHLPERERAAALNEYVNSLMKPRGMDEHSLDKWYDAFSQQHAGERIYLGEYIKQGKGVCSQQATLMKVLCDEMGLQATLVRGSGDPGSPSVINHAWTEVKLPGEQNPLVFDPRQNISGGRYESLGAHKRGFELERGAPMHSRPQDAPLRPADVAVNGQVLNVGAQEVMVGRTSLDPNVEGYQNVSRNHAILRRGDDGVLYIRDNSSHGTFVNGERVPPGREVRVGPEDVVRLGKLDGPQLVLSERAGAAPAGVPRKASYEGQQWDIAGFDPITGDAVLLQPQRGQGWAINSRVVTDAELAANYRELPVGGKTRYRDAEGKVYELWESNGRKQLVVNNEMRVAKRAEITVTGAEQVPPPASRSMVMEAVKEPKQYIAPESARTMADELAEQLPPKSSSAAKIKTVAIEIDERIAHMPVETQPQLRSQLRERIESVEGDNPRELERAFNSFRNDLKAIDPKEKNPSMDFNSQAKRALKDAHYPQGFQLGDDVEVFVHGTTAGNVATYREQQGGRLSGEGGLHRGEFYTSTDRQVVIDYAHAAVKDHENRTKRPNAKEEWTPERPGYVGVVIPKHVAQYLRDHQLVKTIDFGDRRGTQTIFSPGAIAVLEKFGYFFEVRI